MSASVGVKSTNRLSMNVLPCGVAGARGGNGNTEGIETPARAAPRIRLSRTTLSFANPKTHMPALNAVNPVPAGADMVTSLSATTAWSTGHAENWLNTPMPSASDAAQRQSIELCAITYVPLLAARMTAGLTGGVTTS